MARLLTAADIDAAGGDPTARTEIATAMSDLAALSAIITGNANFFNSKKFYVSDTPITGPVNILGITPQYNRFVGMWQDGGGGGGSGAFGAGQLFIKYSNDSKSIENTYAKSRATSWTVTPTVAVQAGDVIFTELWYGDTGSTAGAPTGSMAHVGWYRVGIDGAPTGDSTELPGWFGLATGSGLHIPGSRYAYAINSKQQINFPGQVSTILGPTGTNWGANIIFGVGTATAGGAPFLFTLAAAAVLTVPVAGVFEWDSTGILYFTNAAAKRGQIVTADTTPNTIAAGAGAGTAPTLSIVSGPNSCRVTLIAGTTPTAGGTIATITYGTAFPADSFASFGSASDAAATAIANVRMAGSANGILIKNVTAALTAGQMYIWEINYNGK